MARLARGAAAVAPAAARIDGFGRVSKRPLASAKKTAKTDSTTAARHDALARYVDESQKENVVVEAASEPAGKDWARDFATPQKARAQTKTIPATTTTTTTTPCTTRKRRAADALDADADADTASSPAPTPSKRARKIKTAQTAKTAKTSVAELLQRAADRCTATDSDGDSAYAASFARIRSTSTSPRPASTAPTTPEHPDAEAEADADTDTPFVFDASAPLPRELAELVRLNTAFSKSLALHHAHHGANAPVDVRPLAATVAQAWGKRKVTLDDIQRCLGVAARHTDNAVIRALFLSDYGRGKVCIELRPDAQLTGADVSTLADQLNAAFESSLRTLWAEANTTGAARAAGAADPRHVADRLPRSKMTKCNSLLQASAVRAKGQRTLEELMHGIALKKQEKEAQAALLKAPIPAASAMDVDVDGVPPAPTQPMNLLDRIRYRQLQRSQTPSAAPATPEQLERRAGLQRAGDIAEVLSLLCSSASARQSSRVSFGMTAIVTKVKDSLVRMPIAREEAASCVRLLAAEVCPEWLQIISMGGRELVIMLADRAPSKTDLQQRVQRLL